MRASLSHNFLDFEKDRGGLHVHLHPVGQSRSVISNDSTPWSTWPRRLSHFSQPFVPLQLVRGSAWLCCFVIITADMLLRFASPPYPLERRRQAKQDDDAVSPCKHLCSSRQPWLLVVTGACSGNGWSRLLASRDAAGCRRACLP